MIEELIKDVIDLVNEQRDSQGQISKGKLNAQLRLLLEKSRVENNCILTDVSNITLEEGKALVDYGFNYHTTSQHDGHVPVGNYLQKLVGMKKLIEPPKEWGDYMRENGYDC